jgi:hypothetical protein
MLRWEVDACRRAWDGPSACNCQSSDATVDLKRARSENAEDCPCCHMRSIVEVLTNPGHPLDWALHGRLASSAPQGFEDSAYTVRRRESEESPADSPPNTSAVTSFASLRSEKRQGPSSWWLQGYIQTAVLRWLYISSDYDTIASRERRTFILRGEAFSPLPFYLARTRHAQVRIRQVDLNFRQLTS